jgi:MFS-type transporter involved in bile tolerance (Atg22 family)
MFLISKKDLTQKLKFIILLGMVSLFADVTYEGARSITGPFLATFGASAAVVGFVAGLGELIGYGLRIASGYYVDKTQQYWAITISGYLINLISVPLLALANQWWIAAGLIILERIGKAIRTPPRDAMLSHAGHQIGLGFGFGVHEALDKIGAMLGPLMISIILFCKGDYQYGFAILSIPALCAIIILFYAKNIYQNPQSLEIKKENFTFKKMRNPFWLYLSASSLIAAGYADFSLMAYHFHKEAILTTLWIPIFYAIAMGINTLTAPLLGWIYDRQGFLILIIINFFSCFFAPLVFLGKEKLALLGIILWGIGYGAQASLMRAIIAQMTPKNKRASSYGIFNASFGIFWFFGSFLMGLLYDYSKLYLVVFSIVIQLLAIPLLFLVMKKMYSYT